MKSTFDELKDLIDYIQSVYTEITDEWLRETPTKTNLKNMFQDQTKTKKMTVTERESTLGEYENYTNMDAIVKYTAGIIGVILYKVGETPAEKMEALASENAGLKKTVDMLQECILEMSELVYQ